MTQALHNLKFVHDNDINYIFIYLCFILRLLLFLQCALSSTRRRLLGILTSNGDPHLHMYTTSIRKFV